VRSLFRLVLILLFYLNLSACSESDSENPTINERSNEVETNISASVSRPVPTEEDIRKAAHYSKLNKKIAYGTATLAEARQALSQNDVGALTNTMHALYGLRWNRGIYNLLYGMWNLDKEKYPELAWEQISKAPARIALASTINRIQITNTDEYKDYIRAHKNDEHEFHRAQVVIALGFNGDHADIEYLKTMVSDDNEYVTQSAVTGLALMGSDDARDALGQLWKKHRDDPRATLIEGVLLKVYKVKPSETE
jgi:hypothetical protein